MNIMGRRSTGAWTTTECLRIELSHLLLIQKNRHLSTTLSWNDEDSFMLSDN